MKVSELLKFPVFELYGQDVEITGISYDSRIVNPGNLFIAIRGFQFDGHTFIPQAMENGAIAVVVDHKIPAINITQIVVNDTREAMGEISAAYFGFPSQNLRIIGVTGTNGKTTTTYLTKGILESAGYKVGLIGTIQNIIGTKIIPAKRTTPESFDIQYLFSEMVREGVDYVVMEVSSHALFLQRTVGIEYDIGIFTNLTQDHLDFHDSFQDYLLAKAKLFQDLVCKTKERKAAIINLDSEYALQIAAYSSAPIIGYAIDQYAQVCAKDVEVTNKGVTYRLVTSKGEAQLNLSLTGRFNVYNSLAAIAACLYEGISLSIIKEGLGGISGVPGRFELVDSGQDFAVIIDYAHTPDSLENILNTAKGFAENRVISVFGAGGNRDRKKRPLMGKIAARLSDYIILTSDNPRNEIPKQILKDIEQGIRESTSNVEYDIIINRREAINQAISGAKTGDIVIIAGKGHETYQEFKEETLHFDDKEEALMALKERLS